MNDRKELLKDERKESLKDLLDSVFHGSWMPGVTDTVIYEQVAELQKLTMKAGKFDLKIHNVEGWDLLLPLSFINATKEEIKAKTGGCGPGKIGDWLVPDTMYGESVFLACQGHDWMYGDGETEEDRFYADMVFDWNMKVLILIHPTTDSTLEFEDEKLDRLRLLRATKYFMAVRYCGSGSFGKGETVSVEDIAKEIHEAP